MSNTVLGHHPLRERLQTISGKLLWLGVALAILGFAAIVFPIVSTLVAVFLVGWLLLIFGLFTFYGAFSLHGTGPFFGALLLGLLSIAAGIFFLLNPLAGAVGLTLVIGVIFVFQGAFELFFALEMRPHPGWVAMLVSGLVSVLMAVVIASGWPTISAIVLGILLGVNFLSSGLGYIMASRALKP